MIHRVIRRLWTQLLIAFDDNFTLEGFERTPEKFELPENFSLLDPPIKRKLTICNLFVNQNQSIRNICRVLEVSMGDVVSALIENGLIKERRSKAKIIRQERRLEPPVLSQGWPRSILVKHGGKDNLVAMTSAREGMRVERPSSQGNVTTLPLGDKTKSA